MNEMKLLEEHNVTPLQKFGFTHPFFSIDQNIIFHTWIIIGILTTVLLITRFFLNKKNSIVSFLAQNAVENFMNMIEQNLGFFSYKHCAFIMSLFIFIFSCNLASLIPFLEEPTQNINTTLALGIISFLYIQFYAIKIHGIKSYIKEFFTPFFIMFPINIIGELATIVSISFRLFGNIFGGSIINSIYHSALKGSFIFETLGILTGMNLIVQLFFGLFEGLIQAFVFSMLSLTYLSLAVAQEE